MGLKGIIRPIVHDVQTWNLQAIRIEECDIISVTNLNKHESSTGYIVVCGVSAVLMMCCLHLFYMLI